MLYGFDIEDTRFSIEYVKEKFEILYKKVNLFEVPVHVFIKDKTNIDNVLLNQFLDITSSYNFKFTAHAAHEPDIIKSNQNNNNDIKEIEANLKVAEKINALKITFHQNILEGHVIKLNTPVEVCIENLQRQDPITVQSLAKSNNLGFTLDIPHMFLYHAYNNLGFKRCYEILKYLEPDHLHISNTYFKSGIFFDTIIHLIKGDFKSAFMKSVADFHLPLFTGHIDYKKVFKQLRLPDTVIMEICSINYELFMRSTGSSVKNGYIKDVEYFKKLCKKIKKIKL
jgi:sugar phosphate isomerase/epimerase